MEKELARKLLRLVNDPFNIADINTYINWRIRYCHEQLEVCQDYNEMLRWQGRIAELRRLYQIREEIREKAE